MMKFHNFEEYENWTEHFENCSDYQNIPVAIDDGHKIALDLMTECKSYKTALRRFEKTFKGIQEVADWIPGIEESCGNGFFNDKVDRTSFSGLSEDEVKETLRRGSYSWGVEETSDGVWYIYLNVSGCYR